MTDVNASGRDPHATDPRGATARAAHAFEERAEPAFMSRASWQAIFAGAVIATAFVILLDLLGLAIGLLAVDPLEGAGAFTTIGVIWIVVASVLALVAGGVVAGRLSGAPTLATAAAHGAAVWAVSTITTIVVAVYASSVIVSGAASALSSASSAVANAAEAVAPEDVNLPDFQLPEITMQTLPPEIRTALEEQGLTPEQIRRDFTAIANEVITERERGQIRDALVGGAQEVIRNPGEAENIATRTLENLIGEGGVLTESDLALARSEIERRFGLSPAQSEQLVEQWAADLEQTTEEARQALTGAAENVQQAAEEAADSLSAAAWVAFFASLFGFGGAVAGAAAGRPDLTAIGRDGRRA